MIKNKLYRMFAVVMAVVVLLSSTGFGLVEHECMVRGKTVQLSSLGETHGCQMCAKKVDVRPQKQSFPVFKKKACCEENQKHQKIEVITSVSQSAAKILKVKDVPAEGPSLISLWLNELENSQLIVSTRSFNTFSSRHYGRSMLSFVQSFLI